MLGIGGKILETVINIKRRVEWVDYFKAIAIILVVIGHTTPLFNKYIYQFHVAAFFFIAGYVSNLDRKRVEDVIVNKVFTLILPYTSFALAGVTLVWLLNKFGVLSMVSTVSEVAGLTELWQSIYTWLRCDWLGASWFILALFGATIIQKCILMISGNRVGFIYIIITVLLFFGAYEWKSLGYCPFNIHNFTLYAIAQFYYAIGIISKKAIEVFKNKVRVKPLKVQYHIVILILNIMLFYLFGDVLKFSMDIVSLNVNNPWIDFLMVLNGCVFLWNVSTLLSYVPIAKLKHVLEYVGKNTMGILLLHFIGLKIVTCICVLLGKADKAQIALLCPPSELSNVLWPFYVAVSIVFSLGIWWLLQKIKIVRFLIGDARECYKAIAGKSANNTIVKGIFDTIDEMTTALGNSYTEIWNVWRG